MGFLQTISDDPDPSAGTNFDDTDDFLEALMHAPAAEQQARLGSIMLGAIGGSQSLVLASCATLDIKYTPYVIPVEVARCSILCFLQYCNSQEGRRPQRAHSQEERYRARAAPSQNCGP